MATYSSILTWEIPWTEEPGGLQKSQTQLSDYTTTIGKSGLNIYVWRGKVFPEEVLFEWGFKDWVGGNQVERKEG